MFAEKFNKFFEPKDLKSAYKFNYLIGSGTTFLGFLEIWFMGNVPLGAGLIGVGQLMTGLAFDYRNERIENGYDALRERVEDLEE